MGENIHTKEMGMTLLDSQGEQMNGWTDGQTDLQTSRRTDRQKDRPTDKQTDGQMDRWTDRKTDRQIFCFAQTKLSMTKKIVWNRQFQRFKL